MKVISLNVSGLGNAIEHGLLDWLGKIDAEVICLQDMRTKEQELAKEITEVGDYHSFFYDAERAAYGGTAIYTRTMPKAIIRGFGSSDHDLHGGFLQADFDNVSIASVWVPPAAYADEVDEKLDYLAALHQHLVRTRRKRRNFIFAGCYQIAHRTIDLGNWQSHQRDPGFLPEERAWMDQAMGPLGFIDAFRLKNNLERQHTYWPFDEAQANGLRLDYQLITPKLADFVVAAEILREPRMSPHCAVLVDYEMTP